MANKNTAKQKELNELLKTDPIAYAKKAGITEGTIIWGQLPGYTDGQYMDIKIRPNMLIGFSGDKALLLPLSMTKAAKDGDCYGKILQPAELMQISAASWDCILLAKIEPWMAPKKDPKSEFDNKLAYKTAKQTRIAEYKEATEMGITTIWEADLISPAKAKALPFKINKKGKKILTKAGATNKAKI